MDDEDDVWGTRMSSMVRTARDDICVYMRQVQQRLYVCIGTGKLILEKFLWEWPLVVIMNVRIYNQGVTSKKVENYPLEEGIENTWKT